MIQNSRGVPAVLNAVIATTQSHVIDLNGVKAISAHVITSDVNPTAVTFASLTAGNITANTITIEAHGLITGTKVAATTGSALPAGLSATNYWVIKVDANTLKLATSLANAVAGTAVDITGDGAGTLTPTAAGSNTFKLQKSNTNDSTSWIDITDMSVTIATSAVNSMFEVSEPKYKYMRLLYTSSAGQINLAVAVNIVS
jgi:hypothetical protein